METVVVTASSGSFPGLLNALRSLAVTVEEYPLIDFKAPPNWERLDLAMDQFPSYGAVALTSPRAARALVARIQEVKPSGEFPENRPLLWAGGAATAAAIDGVFKNVRTPSERQIAGSGAAGALAQAMLEDGIEGPVLFLCGKNHREELPARLRRAGIQVDEVVCYDSVLASEPVAHDVAARATMLIVASPSVADLLSRACPHEPRPDLIAAGPTTAASARAAGWTPAAVATHPTTDAVTSAVRSVLASRSQ